MLLKSNSSVAECRQRAAECAEHANNAGNPELGQFYLDMERRWMRLARSCEFSDNLTDMSREIDRRKNQA